MESPIFFVVIPDEINLVLNLGLYYTFTFFTTTNPTVGCVHNAFQVSHKYGISPDMASLPKMIEIGFSEAFGSDLRRGSF